MAEYNSIETPIIPEMPKVVPNQVMFVYTPIASFQKPGIVFPDGEYFSFSKDGKLNVKPLSDKLENIKKSLEDDDEELSKEITELDNKLTTLKEQIIYYNQHYGNALVGNASGTVVTMDGVSPLEHRVTVKLCSATLSPDTDVTIKSRGKNLLCYHDFEDSKDAYTNVGDGTINLDGYSSDQWYYLGHYVLPRGKYCLSGAVPETTLLIQDAESGSTCGEDHGLGATFESSRGGEYVVYLMTWQDVEYENVIVKPQLERGEIPTEFEQFKGETITTTIAEGAELTSMSPNMMITVDFANPDTPETNDIAIDCSYNRDINAALGGGGANATFEMWVLDSSNTFLGEYRYEKGMTWRAFINSSYNDGRFYEYDGSLVCDYEYAGFSTISGTNDYIDGTTYPDWDTAVEVSLDDVIEYPCYFRSY